MTFTKRKKAPPGATEKSGKSYVVSVRLNEEQYQTVQENCRKSGRKLSDFWRHALLNAKVTAVATGGLMAVVHPYCKREIHYEPNLLLKGLHLLYEKNRKA